MSIGEFSTLLFISSLVLIGHIDYQKNGPYLEERDRAGRVIYYMWKTPYKWLFILEVSLLLISVITSNVEVVKNSVENYRVPGVILFFFLVFYLYLGFIYIKKMAMKNDGK